VCSFQIARKANFSSLNPFLDSDRRGTASLAVKYESGTGWPSFFTAIAGAFETSTDFKLILPRMEYHCARCADHHDHVFNDGPPPTGKRCCNSGVAPKFIPKSGKAYCLRSVPPGPDAPAKSLLSPPKS